MEVVLWNRQGIALRTRLGASSSPRPPVPTRVFPEQISTFVGWIYHTPQHPFATHLPEGGYDIRSIQECLGHEDVKTTRCDTYVLIRGGKAVRSPVDRWCGANLIMSDLFGENG